MSTILVPTDFSENSKGGIRFAINMESLTAMKLLFVHVVPDVLAQDNESDHRYLGFNMDDHTIQMRNFIDGCYREINLEPRHYDIAILEGLIVDDQILDLCRMRSDISYISISTRGVSGLGKILGTNTGNLVAKSNIPILVIPHDYLRAPIHVLLYASDLEDSFIEIDRVSNFAKLFDARIEMLYFNNSIDEPKSIILSEIFNYPVHFRSVQKHIFEPFIEQLLDEVRMVKPDVLVLFTGQHRSFFERLFNPLLAEEVAFRPIVPTLIFGRGSR